MEQLEQISKIKEWKLRNIDKKLVEKLLDGDGSSVINNSSPLRKVGNHESTAHASKPKIFSAVNKDSPTEHHHRHKHPDQRNDLNVGYL